MILGFMALLPAVGYLIFMPETLSEAAKEAEKNTQMTKIDEALENEEGDASGVKVPVSAVV